MQCPKCECHFSYKVIIDSYAEEGRRFRCPECMVILYIDPETCGLGKQDTYLLIDQDLDSSESVTLF